MNTIYIIGHSTRPIDEFIELLNTHAITQIVDIRTIPRSRRSPQYMQEALKQSLEDGDVHFVYLKVLGGSRNGEL